MSKEGFIIYTGMYDSIREFLTLEERGMLFDAIHDFHVSGIEPDRSSRIAMAFAIYKNQFRLDDAKHQKRAERAMQNGQKGGRPSNATQETQNNPENPVGFSETQKNPEEPTESYKEKEKDKVKEKEKEKEKVKDKDILSNESIGAGVNFSQHIAVFADRYGTIGNRYKTEVAYIEAVQHITNELNCSEDHAHDVLESQAAADRAFCKAVGRKRKEPDNWLRERFYTKNFQEELRIHQETQNGHGNNTSKRESFTERVIKANRDSGL